MVARQLSNLFAKVCEDEVPPFHVRGDGAFDLTARSITLRLFLRLPPEKRGKSLSSVSTKGLQKLSRELSESLQRWKEKFPSTGYEALSEALRQTPPQFGMQWPLAYLSPNPEPSREYLEISHREKLLEEINLELLQREGDREFTSTSGRKKAAVDQPQPMTEATDDMNARQKGKAFAIGCDKARRGPEGEKTGHKNEGKGDPALLEGKHSVTFRTAEQYLGITDRQRKNLIKKGSLNTEGQGHNRKITSESLRNYLPSENPK
jgi:hypothetical protein